MFEKEKQLIIDHGNKMIKKRLTTSTGGNISVYMREEKIMLITPASVEYDLISVNDIVEMKLDGTQISAQHQLPSSEWRMHTIVYKNRNEINAMVHAHAVHLASVSCVGPLPSIDYLVAFGGSYQIPVTNYASYGTEELANNSWKYLKNHLAVLLRNHGINTIGTSLASAFTKLELLEFCAQMYINAKIIGEPKLIDKKEMIKMVKIFEKYK